MSPIRPDAFPTMYTPASGLLDRNDYAVTKNRKPASTGGGRAWSEEEENYLLQTRLQKMPYKHIAAHLRKTELACRLHYHQLSHGSGRRKRTSSCSSGGSADHSPIMPMAPLDPSRGTPARSLSPPSSSSGYMHGACGQMPLPSIMTGGHTARYPVNPSPQSRLPAILPKPAAMSSSLGNGQQTMRNQHQEQHAPLLPAAQLQRRSPDQTEPRLRLDCSTTPMAAPLPAPMHTAEHVDLNRLHAVYSAHRHSFWSAVAQDYGQGASPAVLEQAFKTGMCCSQRPSHVGPMTPVASPECDERSSYMGQSTRGHDKTRISSILSLEVEGRTDRV